jgi:hypothetical protein
VTSSAHQAATGFLRGALVAVVSQVTAAPLAAAVGMFLPALAPAARIFVPLAGFAAAGAVGGDALGAGPRGARAFSAGCFVAGVVLSVTSPPLSGLTGHEDPAAVIPYAALTFGAAFGLGGCVGGALLGAGRVAHASAAFGGAGALGGIASLVPYLLARFGASGPSGLAVQFLGLVSSVGAVAIPLCVGGSLVARALAARPR